MGDFIGTKWSVSSTTVFVGSWVGAWAGADEAATSSVFLSTVFGSTVIFAVGFSEAGTFDSLGLLDILTLCPQPDTSNSPMSDSSTNFISFLIFDTHMIIPSFLRV